MKKQNALQQIEARINTEIHPVNLLDWVWLRMIIMKIPDDQWEKAVEKAAEVLSQ